MGGATVWLRVKKTSSLKRVFDAWKEVHPGDFWKFVYDGEMLQGHHTIGERDIGDGDQVDVLMDQGGG